MGLKRWQLVVLLIVGSVILVKCGHHKGHESGHEEDGGHKEHEDHFHEEKHKGDKGYHKKVTTFLRLNCVQHFHFHGV